MKLTSIKELAELLSMTRETVGRKLASIQFQDGTKGAKLFPSDRAIRAILGMGGRDETEGHIDYAEANRLLTIKRGEQIDLQNEVLRKERIPLESLETVNDEVQGSVAGLLKGHEGKLLTPELISDIMAEFRSIPQRLQW